jgi:parallel beta-helix repeat protein
MLGNLQYAIISSAANEVESNYFGTSYPGQLEKLVDGGILVQNPLPFRETGFEEISGNVTWSATKMVKKAVLVTGNLTLDGVEIEFYSESGSSYIQVLGSLVIRDSFLHSTNGNFSILFLNDSSGHIENSNLEDQMGIGIHTEKDLTISDTTIRNGRAGILAHQSRGGVFDSVRILNSLMGLSFSESSHYIVNNSVFVSNQGTGVSLYLSSNINVTQCNISSNGLRGVSISLSQSNLLAYNNISYNEEFGLFLSNSQDNLMYGNNFIDNIFQVYDGDNLSSYDYGYPVGGNFWSEYAGSDLLGGPNQDIPGSDGIGDTPYNIPLLSWDRYPLISPSLASGNRSLLDTTAPARITDLAVIGTGAFSATLTWTAPGDDGSSGLASAYDLRYSLSPITEATWNSAVKYNMSSIPGPPGSLESETVSGLWEANDHYFAIKASDGVPNWADLSNVAFGRTRDVSPPQIDYLDVSPEQREVFEPVNISATIVDNVNVAFSVINISTSNSFNTTATMDQGDGDRFYLESSYVELEVHTFSIWTCDNSNNCNYSSGEFEIVDLTPPIANAGSDMMVRIGQSISLDAGNSTDNYGIANYTWIIMDEEEILRHYGQLLTYSFNSEGEFNATLVVTDFSGNQDEDWLRISVTREPTQNPLDLIWLVVLVVVIAVITLLAIATIWQRRRKEEDDETEENQPETPINP